MIMITVITIMTMIIIIPIITVIVRTILLNSRVLNFPLHLDISLSPSKILLWLFIFYLLFGLLRL